RAGRAKGQISQGAGGCATGRASKGPGRRDGGTAARFLWAACRTESGESDFSRCAGWEDGQLAGTGECQARVCVRAGYRSGDRRSGRAGRLLWGGVEYRRGRGHQRARFHYSRLSRGGAESEVSLRGSRLAEGDGLVQSADERTPGDVLPRGDAGDPGRL